MREDDLFIRRMFACTARAHPEKMSFQEFLTVCVVLVSETDDIYTQTVQAFAAGSVEDRLRLVFNMCDLNRDGTVDKQDFCQFMR